MAATAAVAIRPDDFDELELVPFHTLHDARCEVYWRIVPKSEYTQVVAQIAASEQARLALEERTLDQVVPGEQQPEVEHDFRTEDPRQGTHLGRTWRAAEEWFSYRVDARGHTPATLRLTVYGAERDRKFDVVVARQTLTTIILDGDDPDVFEDLDISIPGALAAAWQNAPQEVKFVAHEGSIAGALYGLRLLRAAED